MHTSLSPNIIGADVYRTGDNNNSMSKRLSRMNCSVFALLNRISNFEIMTYRLCLEYQVQYTYIAHRETWFQHPRK